MKKTNEVQAPSLKQRLIETGKEVYKQSLRLEKEDKLAKVSGDIHKKLHRVYSVTTKETHREIPELSDSPNGYSGNYSQSFRTLLEVCSPKNVGMQISFESKKVENQMRKLMSMSVSLLNSVNGKADRVIKLDMQSSTPFRDETIAKMVYDILAEKILPDLRAIPLPLSEQKQKKLDRAKTRREEQRATEKEQSLNLRKSRAHALKTTLKKLASDI